MLICLLFAVVLLPYRVSLLLGRMIGWVVCHIAVKYRREAEDNLRSAFPGMKAAEIKRLRDDCFMNIGMNLIEFGLFSFRPQDFWMRRIRISGEENLRENLAAGRGVIILSGHIGNWELLGAYLSMIGYPINVVARRIYDRRLDALLVWIRGKSRVRTIYRSGRDNMKKMIRSVKKGEALGILVDQDTRVGGVFVDFFGKPAYTPTAVSQFARIRNSVVVPGFIVREKNLGHRVILMDPVECVGDEREQTQKHTEIIENIIREYPSQWVWMHKRWKKQPVY